MVCHLEVRTAYGDCLDRRYPSIWAFDQQRTGRERHINLWVVG